MAYSDFTLTDIKEKLGLLLEEKENLFATIPEASYSAHLKETLKYNLPLAISINTEKARSELIVTPILVELVKQMEQQISFFSGIEFNVDKTKGLNGACDFMLSLSPEQLLIDAPILTVVEAKNDNLNSGFAQCIATVFATRIFNESKGRPLAIHYGVVTTGTLWRFIQLQGQTACVDIDEYHISALPKIFGIFLHLFHTERA